MAEFQRRMRSALALCLVGLALSGCAQGFPKRYDWYGRHPGLYGLAFSAAVTEAVVKAQFGQDYYSYFGDTAFSPGVRGVCDDAQWNAYFVRKKGLHAFFSRQNTIPPVSILDVAASSSLMAILCARARCVPRLNTHFKIPAPI